MTHTLRAGGALLMALLVAGPLAAQDRGAIALGELAQHAGVTARVLMIGAHPDDEDTQLITWLARGRGVETAYLSLTRGDGGQNLIGNELGEALGAIRTEELLAARRLDGGQQYFTRAYDFGFSRNAEETYRHWPKDSLLGDVVTVIRAFRPHVIVSVFSGTRRDGHGHHEVAGLLAREGYDAAGDSLRFPPTRHGVPWTPLKFYRGARFTPSEATLRFDVGEFSVLRGRSYAELAGESRSQHKSQAFGSLQRKGVVLDYLRREASRVVAPGDPNAETSMFDGIDTSWARFRAAIATPTLTDSLRDAFLQLRGALALTHPAAMVPTIARVQGLLDRACARAVCERHPDLQRATELSRQRTETLLLEAAGLAVEANVDHEVVPVRDSVPVRVTVYNRGSSALEFTAPFTSGRERLAPSTSRQFAAVTRLEQRAEPWWLATPRQGDMFTQPVSVMPEARRGIPVTVSLDVTVGGARAVARIPVEYRFADPVRGEVTRPAAAAPAVSITLAKASTYLPANRPIDRAIRVSLRSAASDARDVQVRLTLPAGLAADSATRTVSLPAGGARDVEFRVRGRVPAGTHALSATALVAGVPHDSGYSLVSYDHIRPQRLYRAAQMQIRAVNVALPGRIAVAYIPGVGDNVAEALRELDVPLTVVDPRELASLDLARFTAIVIGPRAYEAHADLAEHTPRLHAYARNGGTVVAQYGQYEMTRPGILPLPITLTRPADRVTVEDAPVRLLAPGAALLSFPNQIVESDFTGWVQERGLYMPREFDPGWTPLVGTNDPGEPENRGSVLATPVGRGMYVYTTLSLFRQLPASVPGAARLMLNLLSATQGAGTTQ